RARAADVPLSTRIFLGTALVVVAVLGLALFATKQRADAAADVATARALSATEAGIGDALESRSRTLRRITAALAQVPAYVSRIGESIRAGDRANLLDQVDELRAQAEADWVLITDARGVLQAWTLRRDLFDEDFSGGALIGRALEGQPTEGLWLEPTPEGDELYQAVGVPVTSPGSTAPLGVVVAALRIDTTFAQQLRRQTSSEIVFFSRDTVGAAHVAVSTMPLRHVAEAIRGLPPARSGDSTPARLTLVADGERYEGAAGPLSTADGVPIGGYAGLHSRDAELAAYRQLSRTIRWAFVAGLLLALGFSVLMARRISRPVRQLVDATRRVTAGQYTGRIEATSADEIGELAGAFDRMLEELREKDRLVEYLQTGVGQRPEGAAAPARGEALLTLGARFAGRYDVMEILGSGGMGVVYRAYDREVGETVAIKALRPGLGALDPTLLERFKQELRLARRITHRNVVRTYDLGEVDGVYYITMEYVHGTTVAALIREAGRLAVPATLTIGKQLCRALEVAHEEGIIHRDIKPQNLLVDPAGFLKVMDFGIARLAEARSEPRGKGLTTVGVIVGTPHYMAPEQLLGEPVDSRTDLYAAGAVLFECVTSRTGYDAPSVPALMAQHLEKEPPDPLTLNPEVPPALARVILKALARRPEDRWQSATDLLRALESI
ncbi:MAG TPA: protein kinase, partial [Gemmatimonadales bacterium]|nr:protein kinase [Gemmatimonadales bacterium]